MIRSIAAAILVLAVGFGVTPGAAEAGSVIQVVTVEVKPGMLDQYRQELKKVRGVLTRLGSKATMRVWSTTAGGPNTGQLLVGLEYPDLASYVSEQDKMTADAEWKKTLAGLDDLRTMTGRSLYQEITP